MARPRIIKYSDKRCWAPLVCSVDDAWFEGAYGGPVFRAMELGGIHKQDRSLSALYAKLKSQPEKLSNGDALYLLILAEVCASSGFTLALCNFEGLREYWGGLNSRGTAILLDLNYTNCPKGELADRYGLRAIHGLMNGVRPQADVFIVTGGPRAFSDEMMARAGESSWWPVRAFPLVSKEDPDILLKDLKSFADYFSQGNQVSPVVELLRSLVRANNECWSHPNEFVEVPRDLGLYSHYENHVLSIKALFHNPEVRCSIPPYPIASSVLCNLLSTSGFAVTCAEGFPEEVRLPRFPFGVLWVAQVWELLSWLLEKAQGYTAATLRQASGSLCVLEIQLNPEYGGNFLAAIEGGRPQGMSTSALKAISSHALRDILKAKLHEDERPVLNSLSSIEGYRGSIGISVTAENLAINWEGNF